MIINDDNVDDNDNDVDITRMTPGRTEAETTGATFLRCGPHRRLSEN